MPLHACRVSLGGRYKGCAHFHTLNWPMYRQIFHWQLYREWRWSRAAVIWQAQGRHLLGQINLLCVFISTREIGLLVFARSTASATCLYTCVYLASSASLLVAHIQWSATGDVSGRLMRYKVDDFLPNCYQETIETQSVLLPSYSVQTLQHMTCYERSYIVDVADVGAVTASARVIMWSFQLYCKYRIRQYRLLVP